MLRFGFYSLLTVATMVVLVAIGATYVRDHFHVTKTAMPGGEVVSIRTPGGDFNIRGHEKLSPSALGVPMYPGARRGKDGGGATFEWKSADGKSDKSVGVAGGEYITSDSAEKVRAWYHEHLPNWVVVTDRGDEKAHFEFSEGGYKRIIAIREKGDGTHIGVASFGEPASN